MWRSYFIIFQTVGLSSFARFQIYFLTFLSFINVIYFETFSVKYVLWTTTICLLVHLNYSTVRYVILSEMFVFIFSSSTSKLSLLDLQLSAQHILVNTLYSLLKVHNSVSSLPRSYLSISYIFTRENSPLAYLAPCFLFHSILYLYCMSSLPAANITWSFF